MYLKKLELIGFKSFCNKTVLHFEPGITAVVGPNGCGKSNIFDSIRWVLGEQSVKALRGSEMQDVIFSGTDKKEPLSMAEVTLTFDNNQRFFNVDHPEVAITRRIFRSGESEYLLNKTTVRLKDILDLLMGTGIGAESYSLVAQGKIDLVLSSRPEDRRLVFDEAAGITKYKSQKRETMRKLEETEQNLLRVNDIITEVKRQIGSLERQANKARRYKEVFEELKALEIKLALIEMTKIRIGKNEIINSLALLGAEEAALLAKIKEQEFKISSHQEELKALEENIMSVKEGFLNLNNDLIRNQGHITFNSERVRELETTKKHLQTQIELAKSKLILDEEKINKMRDEYDGIAKNIADKKLLLQEKESQLEDIASGIKASLEKIATTKRDILELVSKIANTRNEISDATSKKQIHLARKKRLELERAKVTEEKTTVEIEHGNILQEISGLHKAIEDLNTGICELKQGSEQETASLNNISAEIDNLEKEKLSLESHKEFLQKLKSKYEDISESLNAVIYLDKLPAEKITGLVVKITSLEESSLKMSGEAKPFELDTHKITDRIADILQKIDALNSAKTIKQSTIEGLNKSMLELQGQLRNQEISLANKDASLETISEQFSKTQEELEVINIEHSEVQQELVAWENKISEQVIYLVSQDSEQMAYEELISCEQNKITAGTSLKEEVLVTIAQIKTEIDGLHKKIVSDEATLKMLQESYNQDKESLLILARQDQEADEKIIFLNSEISSLENKNIELNTNIETQGISLKTAEEKYQQVSEGASDVVKSIDSDRKILDNLKNRLYELQMQNKDVDFKFQSTKDRMFQAYKVELAGIGIPEEMTDEGVLAEEILRLKEKLDSYGTVNLVAIEEYDELKKRYDFLTQQLNDLVSAKDTLVEAIQKINRTTKRMFLETFEKVRVEFRNYFRLLFNGGDAQVFLIDEQDALESGIEMICRPPGKKLQNVLLLSGGEKSLSAIALIFAIFKIKPSPFCALDEIDAALDEANVDRYSRLLKDFAKQSQFIVITHNKKTIVHADVMYGITMEESGVSKIVSVKFAQNKTEDRYKQADLAVSKPL